MPSNAKLSYAALGGQPIVSITSAITAFAENGWDTSQFAGLANSFNSPLGEEFGHGWVLMTRRSLNNLDTAAAHTLLFGEGESNESIELEGIYIRAAKRVSPGASQDDSSLYMVELVDTRYYLRRKSINRRFNCRNLRDTTDTYVTETLNAGTPWTWAEIITEIWSENHILIGSIGTLPSFADMTSTPENIRYEGLSAWHALNDFCARCGAAVVYDNAFANNFYVVRMGVITGDTDPPFFGEGGTTVTKEGFEATFSSDPTARPVGGGDGLIVDEETLQGDSMIPRIVTVMFPTEFGGSQIKDELLSDFGKWYPVQIDGADSAVLPTTVACDFHDATGDEARIPRPDFNSDSEVIRYESITARFSDVADATPLNQTTLETRAKEIARDLYRTLHDCSYAHMAYMGIKYQDDANPLIHGKCVSEVAWGDYGNGFRTDVWRKLPRLMPDEPPLLIQPGSTGGGAQQIQFEITSIDCVTGEITADITDVICVGAVDAIGDSVSLDDPLGFLTGNSELMIGHSGFATKMSKDGPYGSPCIYKITAMDDLGTNCA